MGILGALFPKETEITVTVVIQCSECQHCQHCFLVTGFRGMNGAVVPTLCTQELFFFFFFFLHRSMLFACRLYNLPANKQNKSKNQNKKEKEGGGGGRNQKKSGQYVPCAITNNMTGWWYKFAITYILYI